MTTITRLLALITAVGISALWMPAPTQATEAAVGGLVDRVSQDPVSPSSKYVVWVPGSYAETGGDYPLLVFLHGSQVFGTDGRRQLATGLPSYLRKDPEFLKAHADTLGKLLIAFPQARERSFWRGDDTRLVLSIVADVQKHYRVDRRRIYLTGLSMGGYGVWNVAVEYPNFWAAIAPICGAGDPTQAARIKHIPCWCWHGDKDDRVPVQHSRDMIAALRAAGGTPRYTELPGVGHGSYGPAYRSREFWTWLLEQRQPER
jgi:predicted peptidase